MITWPDALVNDLARRRAVLVLGSGVSRHSVGRGGIRPPDWRGFLEAAHARLEQPDINISNAIDSGDWLHACEWLKRRLDEQWVPLLRETFTTPRFMPADIHRQIIALDSRIVFSLNFDNIYERAVEQMHQGSHIIKTFFDRDLSDFLRGDSRYIVKIHGSMNNTDKLIFTRKDYANARIENSSFYQAFDACLLTHTFVFLGAGYNDPDVSLLLENQAFSFPSSRPHYFICAHTDNNDIKVSLRENRNLKTLEYDKIDENHSGLVAEIQCLSDLVELRKSEMTASLNW